MKVIIDRIVGDIAAVELDGRTINVPLALFPDAHEGDTVEITVLGRRPLDREEPPHEIFERLRGKSRRGRKTKPERVEEGSAAPADVSADGSHPCHPSDTSDNSGTSVTSDTSETS